MIASFYNFDQLKFESALNKRRAGINNFFCVENISRDRLEKIMLIYKPSEEGTRDDD
jgi:hypothetical protein